MADPMRVIESPMPHEGVVNFLNDYREFVDRADKAEAQGTHYRPVPKQLLYRPETDRVIGALFALCDNGRIYELMDGATAWQEVEGP